MNNTAGALRFIPGRAGPRSAGSLRQGTSSPPHGDAAHHAVAVASLVDAANELLQRAAELISSARELHSGPQLSVCELQARRSDRSQGDSDSCQDAVFRLDEETWLIAFDGRSIRLRPARGLELLAHLLRRPGERVHVLELTRQKGPGGDHDAYRALMACRAQLAELREILVEANAHHDWARASRAQDHIEQLTEELLRRIGFGSRERRSGAAAERARINATRAIAGSLRRIRDEHPILGQHFERTVRTGTFCCYAPDPRAPLRWD